MGSYPRKEVAEVGLSPELRGCLGGGWLAGGPLWGSVVSVGAGQVLRGCRGDRSQSQEWPAGGHSRSSGQGLFSMALLASS